MELKDSEITLLELAHISIKDGNSMENHDDIWKAFHLGVKYQQQKTIEQDRLLEETK